MQILFTRYQNNNLSFGAMKKSQFKGIDRFVVEKYKAPIEKWNGMDEFKAFCKSLTQKIKDADYMGRQEETIGQRKEMLKEWFNYVLTENTAYTGSIALMILEAITAPLRPNEDNLPPVLNKSILSATVEQAKNELEADPSAQVNFEKEYRLNLKNKFFEEEENLDESLNGWITIPSKKHDSQKFEENVGKLKTLSHNSWCTKSFNAEPYLSDGDFHIYMEKGKPKLGVRFFGAKVQEIQGEKNNGRIPVKYYDIIMSHLKDCKYCFDAFITINDLKDSKKYVDSILAKFPNGFKNYSAKEIFDIFDIEYKEDSDGLLIISEYAQPNWNTTFEDLGIDENELFKSIKRIEGDADFRNSNIKSLGNLQFIGGCAIFMGSQITDIGNLETIGGYADFRESKITSLNNIQSIGGNALFQDSQVKDIGNLQSIGGNADFQGSQITSLKNLESIGGDANFINSQITDLGKLLSIGRCAFYGHSPLTSLGNLQYIGGNALFEYSEITDIGNLKSIGGDAVFESSKITTLGNLESIGGYADFRNSKVTSLCNLQSIGNGVSFYNSLITDLCNLQSIGGNALLCGSQIVNLGNLKFVGGDVNINSSKISKEMLLNQVRVAGQIYG